MSDTAQHRGEPPCTRSCRQGLRVLVQCPDLTGATTRSSIACCVTWRWVLAILLRSGKPNPAASKPVRPLSPGDHVTTTELATPAEGRLCHYHRHYHRARHRPPPPSARPPDRECGGRSRSRLWSSSWCPVLEAFAFTGTYLRYSRTTSNDRQRPVDGDHIKINHRSPAPPPRTPVHGLSVTDGPPSGTTRSSGACMRRGVAQPKRAVRAPATAPSL